MGEWQMNWSEWRNGWTNLVAATIAQAVAVIHFYSLGMFFEPIQQDFGWSRTLITSGLTVASVVAVIGAPFAGMLIDRVGPRRVAVIGILLYCSAVAGFSLMTPSIPLYFALWICLALAALSVKTTVWIAAIIHSFVQHRGIAIAIVLSGTGMGAIVIPALSRLFIDQFGWRSAYLGLGATGFLLAAPLIFLFFGKGRDAPVADAAALQAPSEPLLKQIMSRRFVQLVSIAMLCSLSLVGISVHLIPILAERGIDRVEAAQIAGLMGAAALVGRLATGSMLDRWSARAVGTVVIGIGVVGVLMLLTAPSPLFVWIAAICLGTSLGAELDIVTFLAARLFARHYFATLFGVIVGVLTLCTGVGPLAAARIFDVTGSYDLWLGSGVVSLVVAAALMAMLDVKPAAAPQPVLA
jgi:predicted MFS family arabinose efflux permease